MNKAIIVGDRPATVLGWHAWMHHRSNVELPAAWLVFNAPRPIPGDLEWEGDFRHGIHYAALDPAKAEGGDGDRRHHAWQLAQIKSLDGWLVEWKTVGQMREELNAFYLAEYGPAEADSVAASVAASDDQDVIAAWFSNQQAE